MSTTPQRGKSLWKRRRLWLALSVSVLLHLLLLPELDLIPEENHDTVILATLKTDTPERADDADQRGELQTESRPLSSPSQPPAPKKPPVPTEPEQAAKADAPKQVTATKATKKVQTTSEPKPPSRTATETKSTQTPQRTANARESQIPPSPSESASLTSSASFQGQDQRFSDPKEQQYYEQLMAHLNSKLPAHPDGISGTVRLQIAINYGAVITGVDIIQSSGHQATDEWARRAILSTSPVPSVPPELSQPYYFRPTLRLTN